jgi:hypothetical protein
MRKIPFMRKYNGRDTELGLFRPEYDPESLMHTVQADRDVNPPFVQWSGPWQIDFRDHVARPIG